MNSGRDVWFYWCNDDRDVSGSLTHERMGRGREIARDERTERNERVFDQTTQHLMATHAPEDHVGWQQQHMSEFCWRAVYCLLPESIVLLHLDIV